MYYKDRADPGWLVWDGPPAGVKPSKINSFWKTFFFRHVETLSRRAPRRSSSPEALPAPLHAAHLLGD